MKALDDSDPAATTAAAGVACVVVGTEAAVLRRQLGPVAWCGLEALVAVSDHGGLAVISVRSLAAVLG